MNADTVAILISYYLVGMLMDVLSTQVAISGGYGREGNRIPRWFFEQFGLVGRQILSEVFLILLLTGFWLGTLVFVGPLWAAVLFVLACGILGTMRSGVGLWNIGICVQVYRQWCRLRSVATILRVAGGQQRWIYEVNRPLPAAKG